jgi:serine/threonine protein kinase
MECLSDKAVLDFVEGRARNAAEQIDEHIAQCATCRELVAETAKFYFSGTRHPEKGPGAATVKLGADDSVSLGRDFRDANDDALKPGSFVGRYLLLRPIGAGGMGVVWAAHDPALGRTVALKLIRADREDESDHLGDRLQREARAMAKLSHPNVVHVYDTGIHHGDVFVAMELVRGSTLRAWLRAEPRSWREIARAFVQAGEGLVAAHAAGLVHRDFKPENVLYGDDGRVKVTDFGLARHAAMLEAAEAPRASVPAKAVTTSPHTLPTLTHAGRLAGTPAYMALEQLHGRGADARSDQFGFSVSFYEALYGVRPFVAHDIEGFKHAVSRGEVTESASASDVPSQLNAILRRGLCARADDRFASMQELLDRVKTVIDETDGADVPHERPVGAAAVTEFDQVVPTTGGGSTSSTRRRSVAKRALAVVFVASVVSAGLVAARTLRSGTSEQRTNASSAEAPAIESHAPPAALSTAPVPSIATSASEPMASSVATEPSAPKRSTRPHPPMRKAPPSARPASAPSRTHDDSALKPFDEGAH